MEISADLYPKPLILNSPSKNGHDKYKVFYFTKKYSQCKNTGSNQLN